MGMWFLKSTPEPDVPFFAWSSAEHSVGITVFDQEHQRLATLMGQVHATLLEKHDRALALTLIESLIQETRAHFDHEERVMEELGFHEREAHAAEHATLIQEAKVQLQMFRSGTFSALAMPNFLKAWLIPHMQVTDRKYAACLRRHGFR